jgi:hypothetical protein
MEQNRNVKEQQDTWYITILGRNCIRQQYTWYVTLLDMAYDRHIVGIFHIRKQQVVHCVVGRIVALDTSSPSVHRKSKKYTGAPILTVMKLKEDV